MNRYLVLIAYESSGWEEGDEATQQYYFDAHHAFERYVDEHGKRLGSAALADADTATTLRRDGEDVTITDGPFVETTETIGGYYDVELPDLDAAIAAAKLLPDAYTIELRPVMVIEGYEHES